ncbi:WXG100 family type VII secretion target [Nocardia beijingensis]|uniref:WXG100 family type VII secretion target n=1 Tax=Nocardia implantans TaxID=3108168 RepID=A0ABU6B4C7_9NOCA|nr:WXG100 family type VII secretion target [Nocardia beijingensis]MEB3514638.1 WXG100 family type VII secretion target [Nocardia sp. CDC186]
MTSSPDGSGRDFAVVPAEVADAGKYVQRVAESLVNGLRSLDSDITTLLESWKGTSADAYSAGWIETKQGADTVLDALAAMAELLGVTSQVVTDEDSSRASVTASLTSSLDLPEL